MPRGEGIRIVAAFAVLGLGSLMVVLRLFDLQVTPAQAALRRADRQAQRSEVLPAPRGTITDRHGELLAFDRPVWEIRAEVTLRADDIQRTHFESTHFFAARERALYDLCWAMSKDVELIGDSDGIDELQSQLRWRLDRKIKRAIDDGKVTKGRIRADVLVRYGMDDAAPVEALRSLDRRLGAGRPQRPGEKTPYHVTMHLLRRFERVYPAGDATAGVVGTVRRDKVDRADDRVGKSGLERLAVLIPGDAGSRSFLVRGGGAPFWANLEQPADSPVELRTTLDLELQRCADLELQNAADAVAAKYGHPPEWGALILVDVETGGLLAMASYTASTDGGRDIYGAFAPTQRMFEPGSVVKPMHIALGLERGAFPWEFEVDCRPGYLAGSEYVGEVGRLPRRVIEDAHDCDRYSVRRILVESSNIGAVRLGLRLGAEGIEDYLQLFGFGRRTGIRFPGELRGSRPGHLPSMRRNEQYVYTGPSVCFGYQIAATPLQVARAYLTLISGRPRELHLVESLSRDAETVRHPAEPAGGAFLGDVSLDRIKDALSGVVYDDNDNATGRHLGLWLRDQDLPEGLVGGKTGTSEYHGNVRRWDGEKVNAMVRTASFAGFAPVQEPRFLVFCVLQKVGASRFYGGSYSAPAAGRLILKALKQS